MLGRRMVLVASAALASVVACSADRREPVPAPPPGPTTTSTTSSTVAATTTTEERPAPSTTSSSTSTSTSSSTSTTAPAMAPEQAAQAWATFDLVLTRELIGRGDYAASVAVAVDGNLVHTGAYGTRVPPPLPAPPAAPPPVAPPPAEPAPTTTVAPAAPLEPIDPHDRLRIASISKMITAIVVLQLVEDGRIGLDEPVGDRLAQQVGALPVDGGVSVMTVRQLLSHTAGFPEYQRTFFGGDVDSCPTVANLGLSRPLRGAPGTVYEYSNLNYCLLGLLVEQVTGRPYPEVVRQRLLVPLGIKGMRVAATFDVGPSEVVHPSGPGRNYMEVLGAAGAWVATPADLVRIIDSLDLTKPGFKPLDASTIELMRQPAPPPIIYKPDRWYGLGLIVYTDGTWGHTGTMENTHTMVLHRPDGVAWSILVSGEVPFNTDNLRRIFDQAVDESGVVF